MNLDWQLDLAITALGEIVKIICVGLDFWHVIFKCEGFPGGTSGKEPACQCRRHEK